VAEIVKGHLLDVIHALFTICTFIVSAGTGVRVCSFVKGTMEDGLEDRVVCLLFITGFFMFLVTNGY
jgi:heme/copper-type cytochrome/quinol oxidase subunit 1